jgi:hypothetical protein
MKPKGELVTAKQAPLHLIDRISGNLLLVLMFVAVFLVPVMPARIGTFLYPACFTGIFIFTALSLRTGKQLHLTASLLLAALVWTAEFAGLPWLRFFSRLVQVIYFLWVVISLVTQIASSQTATRKVVVQSISGYFLLGFALNLMVMMLATIVPDAYNIPVDATNSQRRFELINTFTYYSFITYATVGYGDVIPVKPMARSLALLIGVSGQLYVATIIAMLVGKYIGRKN